MVMRAAVLATPTMWAMAMVTRLAGNDERKGKGGKQKCDGDEGGGHQRRQGRQGNGDGNKDGGQADSDGKDEGDGDKDEGGG